MADIVRSEMPCAACKYMDEICVENCPFSPYFSPDEPEMFAAVNRVFGQDQFCKLVRDAPEEKRVEAANSLVYEATLRMNDPVRGSMGAIVALDNYLKYLETQYNEMRDRFSIFHSSFFTQPPFPPLPPLPSLPRTETPPTPPF